MALLYPWHPGVRAFSGRFYQLATAGSVKPRLRLAFVDAGTSPLTLIGLETWT
jgi:hypothetical protein